MANEIQTDQIHGLGTLYAVVRTSSGLYLAGTTPEAYNAGHWASYAVSLSEIGATGTYAAAFPAAASGVYRAAVYLQAGASPAVGDLAVDSLEVRWAGAAVEPPQTGDSYARVGAAGAGLTAVALASTGLDAVTVEVGLNARQALSLASAVMAGTIAGAGTGTITISGAGVATTRITAAVDDAGNRTPSLAPPV